MNGVLVLVLDMLLSNLVLVQELKHREKQIDGTGKGQHGMLINFCTSPFPFCLGVLVFIGSIGIDI
jgi:hypothetical protein